MKVCVDGARILQEIDTLALYSDAPAPAVTRVLWTARDMEARTYLTGLFEEAGLNVRTDGLGNTYARWEGGESALPAVATGSHVDAIPHSGRYDGVVGVLGGLEALRALRQAGFKPRRSLELIVFTAEEPTRFGLGCLGSRAMSGALEPAQLLALKDAEGVALDEARSAVGFHDELAGIRLPGDHYDSFVELHIEQGPHLEQDGAKIGVVSAIAAPATLRLTITGEGGHAGARLMPGRRDAGLAAAELALAVEKATLSTGVVDTVGTTGLFEIHPGAVNSIPSRAQLEIDVRDIDAARRDDVVEQIKAAWEEIKTRRKVEGELETLNADPPATCDERIVAAAEKAALASRASHLRMVSRAYHDSLFMARLCPTGMIFIPSKDGISHRPDEYSSPEDITLGVQVLALTLAELAA